MTPEAILEGGRQILEPLLAGEGFKLAGISRGQGSGGQFAAARWVRGDQYIELWVRFALGAVTFGWGRDSFDFSVLAQALAADTAYPGFSDDPIDGFRHLLQDLTGPLARVVGDGHEGVHALLEQTDPPRRQLP